MLLKYDDEQIFKWIKELINCLYYLLKMYLISFMNVHERSIFNEIILLNWCKF